MGCTSPSVALASAGLAALLFASGAQTPLLALLALRRPRILALVVAPYAASLAVAASVAPLLGGSSAAGLRAVALAPALLAAPRVAPHVAARRDRVGALTAGTVAAAVLLNAVGPNGFAALGATLLAFVVGAAITGAVPMLPEIVRVVVRRLQDAAYLVVLGTGVVAVAGAGALDLAAISAAAVVLAAGLAAAGLVAVAFGVDLTSALLGAGSRDPAVAVALALAFGPGAAAVPVAYAGLLAVTLLGLGLRARRVAPTIRP